MTKTYTMNCYSEAEIFRKTDALVAQGYEVDVEQIRVPGMEFETPRYRLVFWRAKR